jgi:hypothetical protein
MGTLWGDSPPDPMQLAQWVSCLNGDWMHPTVGFGDPTGYDFHPQYFYICMEGSTLDEVAIHFVGNTSERILILYDASVESCSASGSRGLAVTFLTEQASERTVTLEKNAGAARSRQTHISLVPYLTAGFGR